MQTSKIYLGDFLKAVSGYFLEGSFLVSHIMEDPNKKLKTEALWWQPGITLFVQLSAWIAGPIIIALFAGKWLDEKYGTDPWWFLGLTGAAFIITNVGIVYQAVKFMNKVKEEADQKTEKRKNTEKNC